MAGIRVVWGMIEILMASYQLLLLGKNLVKRVLFYFSTRNVHIVRTLFIHFVIHHWMAFKIVMAGLHRVQRDAMLSNA